MRDIEVPRSGAAAIRRLRPRRIIDMCSGAGLRPQQFVRRRRATSSEGQGKPFAIPQVSSPPS